MNDPDVIVVGGGPAGSSTAWALALAGVNVCLLDRARFPRDKPCSEYMSPEASRVLAAMGALGAVEGAGAAQLAGMKVRSPAGDVIHGDFVADHGYRGYRDRGLALPRVVLDAILLERARAAGVRVEEEIRVTDVLRDSRGAIAGVRTLARSGSAQERRARVVVAADGLRSLIARRTGLARSSRWMRRLALVTHYRGVSGVGAYGEMHVERDGYAGIADVGGGLANVAVVVPLAHATRISRDREGFLRAWIARRPQLAPRFARAERATPVHVTGPFASRARRAWAPGLALVGDAADFFDPFTGEGIYAALRGGEMLAPALLAALAAPGARAAADALRAYDTARRREFGGKWAVERLVGAAVAYPPLMNRTARSLSQRKDLADIFVGVAGDFVPAREVLRPSYVWRVLVGGGQRGGPPPMNEAAHSPRLCTIESAPVGPAHRVVAPEPGGD